MKNRWIYLLAGVLCLFPALLKAQITAQGQSSRLVIWAAIGIEQQIGKNWTNKNVVAYSTNSGMDSWNPFAYSGIFTVREELVYRISPKFKVSQGVFYALRSYYEPGHPPYLNEIRLYPQFYHEFSAGRVKFSQCLRFDFRFFSGPGFARYEKPFEFRNRYYFKATIPLNQLEKHFLVGITEFFFSTSQRLNSNNTLEFSPYHFSENRTSLCYRRHFKKPDMYFDIGLMAQTWRNSNKLFYESLLLQMDIIFINPFQKKASAVHK